MDLKGYRIGGCTVIAENEDEAKRMYQEQNTIFPLPQVVEEDLDKIFYYFNLKDIEDEDHVHIYDRKYPNGKEIQASLFRPIASKYRNVIGTKKEIVYWNY